MRGVLVALALLLGLALPGPVSCGDLPRVLIQRGERFLAMGNLDAAAANYCKVLECCEGTADAAEAHNDLGVIHVRRGQQAQAIAEYEKSIAINGYPLAQFNLGKLYLDRYESGGADKDRTAARAFLRSFRHHLHNDKNLPPVVEYNRAEVERFVRDSLEKLEKRGGAE